MNLTRKNAMLSNSIWLVIAILFAAIFFTTGPSNFHLEASKGSRILVAVVGFSASIALNEIFQATGSVPVGWLFFLAYGTVVLVSLLHAMGALWLDYRGNFNG